MSISRRDLMRAAIASGVALACPSWLHAGGVGSLPTGWNRRLVIVELSGGNDGLNMFAPFNDALYASKRPTIYLKNADLRSFNDGKNVKMNWNLVDGVGNGRFKRLYDEGKLAVALGVGMPGSSRSHFRGIDIWNSGSDAATTWSTGWLQRAYMSQTLAGGNVAHGAVLDRPTSSPLVGSPSLKALAMRDPLSFLKQSADMSDLSANRTDALNHVLRVRKDIFDARAEIVAKLGYNESLKTMSSKPTFTRFVDANTAKYPNGAPLFPLKPAVPGKPEEESWFGQQCRSVAELISAGVAIPIYKIHLGGFDNHSGQYAKHNDLLAELAHGLTGLTEALRQKGKLADTLIMTYSEFGRRIEENGSKGTDHGTLAPHIMISDESNLQGSRVIGSQPPLNVVDSRGDLAWADGVSIDYRQLYATALQFLGLPQNVFSTTYQPLNILGTSLLTP